MVEFNNGFVTALALFYGHREQFREASKIVGYDMRIYGASDHLINIEYPLEIPENLKERIKAFVSWVFSLRLERPTVDEGNRIFDTCKDILKEIDEKIFGLKVEVNYP